MDSLRSYIEDTINCSCNICTACRIHFELKIQEQCDKHNIDGYTWIYMNHEHRRDATRPLLKQFGYSQDTYQNINSTQFAKYCVDNKHKLYKEQQLELKLCTE